MPPTTYLHIQGGEGDAIRVVELPGSAIRVGRGAQCEVRLLEPRLADVQCLLRRRGDRWHIQPVGPNGLLSIEGRLVDYPRDLDFGVPIVVGAYRLVLHPTRWEDLTAPAPAATLRADPPVETPRTPPPSTSTSLRAPERRAVDADDDDRLKRWQARLDQRDRWLQTRQEEKKWEARWRLAGETLRARAAGPAPSSTKPIAPEAGAERSAPPPVAGPARVAPAPPSPSVPHPSSNPSFARPSTGLRMIPRPAPEEAVAAAAADPAPEVVHVEEHPVAAPAEVIALSIVEAEPFVEPEIETVEPAEEVVVALSVAEPVEVEVEPATVEVEPPEPVAEVEIVREPVEPAVLPAVRPPLVGARPDPVGFWHDHVAAAEPEPKPAESAAWADQTARQPLSPPPPAFAESSPGVRRDRDEFPTAASIFAAQGFRSPPPTAPAPPTATRRPAPRPTEAREPASWPVSPWLAAPPALLVAAALFAAGAVLGVSWTREGLEVAAAAHAASRADGALAAPLDPTIKAETRWWKAAAGHAALWNAAIERANEASDRLAEAREALEAAARAAPLDRRVKLARARLDPSDLALRSGLSRDVVALAMAGRSYRTAGKVDASIRAYRRAIELAVAVELDRLAPPTFDDDPQVRRYRLAREPLAAWVVRDIVDASGWSYAEWSACLPRTALARLVAGRVLREKGSPDADQALDQALDPALEIPTDPNRAAEHFAAQGEALALREQKARAADCYREAIARTTLNADRRRWRLGLAEIIGSAGGGKERADLLEAAKIDDPMDDVTRRAFEAQKNGGLK